MFKSKPILAVALLSAATVLGAAGLAFGAQYSFSNQSIPGYGHWFCTASHSATTAPNASATLTYTSGGGALNFSVGTGGSNVNGNCQGGTQTSPQWYSDAPNYTVYMLGGDQNGYSYQMWIGSPPAYTGTTLATGSYTI